LRRILNGEVTLLVLPVLVLTAMIVPSTFATTIQLGINGDAQIGSNYIDFGQYPSGAPYTPAPGYGTFEVSLVNAGVFSSAGVTTGEFGTIQSLNEGTGSITLPSAFMTFDTGAANLQLWATNIPAGVDGPFILTDTLVGAVASFDVDGFIWDTNSSMKVDTFTGTFSATFSGETVASLLGDLPVDTPFSATFSATVIPVVPTPEPSTTVLFSLGLAVLVAGCMARQRFVSAV
jgi:hypothetical protein